jgi:hypothetical protein
MAGQASASDKHLFTDENPQFATPRLARPILEIK